MTDESKVERAVVTINGDGEATEVTFRGEVIWQAAKLSAPFLRKALDEAKAEIERLHSALAAAQQRIAELERELANERARDTHSCHDQCELPLCVAQRRIADAELALRAYDTAGTSEYWLRHGRKGEGA